METFDLDSFLSALGGSNVTAIIGFSLMIVIFVLRKVLEKVLSKKNLDLFAAGAAVVGSVAGGLAYGDGTWVAIVGSVVSGLVIGATAVGFWELLGSRLAEVYGRSSAEAPADESEEKKG